jgi:hypothetical protein
MAETIIINSVAGGEQDLEVSADQLTSRQAKTIAYSRLVPFVLSVLKGVVNRLQGIRVPNLPTLDEHFWVHFDRPWGDTYKETLPQLQAKGHTGFYCNGGREPKDEKGYQDGYDWVTLGSMGTDALNHNPGLTMLWSLEQIEAYMWARIVPRPGVKYAIANHEYAWFAEGGGSGPSYWDNVQNKDTPFVSALDGGTYTLQQIYNQGGINLLLAHLHARRNQMGAIWCEIWRAKNPGTFAANGDNCPFAAINYNGDLSGYSVLNLQNIPYSILRQHAGFGFGAVNGGQVTLNGRAYNLKGVECEYYDFFVQYYYPFDVYWKASDMNDLLSTQDPAKNTIDYWQAKTWFGRHHMYVAPIQYMVRKRLLELHAQQGGKDMTGLKVADMSQHMYEGPKTSVCAENSSRTYPTIVGEGPSSFMKFVHENLPGTNQRLYLHKEVIWSRVIQAACLYWGTLTWWEADAIDYSQGKYGLFHQRSQEMRQNVLDHILVDNDIWKNSAGKQVALSGIQMRYRQNGGGWTEWFPSLSPIEARWGTAQYRPYIIKVFRAGKTYYYFQAAQEDTDTTEIEFQHNGVIYTGVLLKGCQPATRAIRENL